MELTANAFDWHDAKDAASLVKHALPLVFCARLFRDPKRVVVSTIREKDREDRYKVLGSIDGKLYVAVYTERNAVFWLISVRRANQKETRLIMARFKLGRDVLPRLTPEQQVIRTRCRPT